MAADYIIESPAPGPVSKLFGLVFAAGFGGLGGAAILGVLAPGTPAIVRFGGGGLFMLAGLAVLWSTFSPWRDRVRIDADARAIVFEKVKGDTVKPDRSLAFSDIQKLYLNSQIRGFHNTTGEGGQEILSAISRAGKQHILYIGGWQAGREHYDRLRDLVDAA